MTAIEKVLAAHAGVAQVAPGDIVVTEVDTVVLLDMNFLTGNALNPPIIKTDRPERIVVVFDRPGRFVRPADQPHAQEES